MSSNRALTGGTNDVNGQFLTLTLTQSAADTTTSGSFPIPIQRLPTNGRAQVLEILKLFFYYTVPPEVDGNISMTLSTTSFGITAASIVDPRVILQNQAAVRLTTSGMYLIKQPDVYDMTDNAGHGFLVATDNVFLQVASVTTGSSNNCTVKILYRWKNVSLAEYIGIVQSQQ